ncbi:MAG: type 1 glutamine amidotransferase [Polyangiaceae bacterium]|nr:type 1 glutamine amidotransferase [Polyangiaceae bacterium]
MAEVAMIVGPEFEDAEFRIPYERLREAGHVVTLFGSRGGETVHGKRGKERARIDSACRDGKPTSYDAIVIPGGHSPDHLRTDESVVEFVRVFAKTGRPMAVVCHGPQLLIEADLVRGKRLTSWPSIRRDLENAGATWLDEEVVRDGPLITSRKPADLEAFSEALLETLA